MKLPTPIFIFVLALLFASAVMLLTGCATRTIYVPYGEPVRLAAPVKGAKVWIVDKDGKAVRGTVDLQEGWYALPDTERKPAR